MAALTEAERNDAIKRLGEVVGELVLDSQASTAIVFSSILEEHLRAAMAVKMPNINNRVGKVLFEGYGPLATFRSKIDLAYALAILTKEQFDDAHNIRKIRNKFAHTSKKVNFETPTVIEICKRLSTYDVKEKKLLNVYAAAIDALVQHLSKEFDIGVVVRALHEKAEYAPPEARSSLATKSGSD